MQSYVFGYNYQESWIEKDHEELRVKLLKETWRSGVMTVGDCSYCSVYGGDGDVVDVVWGIDGTRDIIFCGEGNDSVDWCCCYDYPKNISIIGGTGNDSMDIHGGKGQCDRYDSETKITTGPDFDGHMYFVDCGEGEDTVFGSNGEDTIYGGDGNDYILGNETQLGLDGWGESDWGDFIYGGTGNDTVLAGPGDDHIEGEHGNDVLYGDKDNDQIYGGTGNDCIGGGFGADWIYGGVGNDSLWGSYVGDDQAMDVFVFRIDEGQQVDEVMDFESGFDGIWCQDGSFTKAEVHGSDIWAYAGDDRGMIIHNAVGKQIKWANSDGQINIYQA